MSFFQNRNAWKSTSAHCGNRSKKVMFPLALGGPVWSNIWESVEAYAPHLPTDVRDPPRRGIALCTGGQIPISPSFRRPFDTLVTWMPLPRFISSPQVWNWERANLLFLAFEPHGLGYPEKEENRTRSEAEGRVKRGSGWKQETKLHHQQMFQKCWRSNSCSPA